MKPKLYRLNLFIALNAIFEFPTIIINDHGSSRMTFEFIIF